MNCDECARLIALYRKIVEQRRAFVDKSVGAAGDEALAASRKAYELMTDCLQASERFLRHIKEQHTHAA